MGLIRNVKPQIFLAAFGKHPGWSDFMDDIGMETETLIDAKRIMFVKGIASQIETGAWDKLEPEMRISDFNHVFLWRRSDRFLIGRMWSSVDAKGRREFPMVICADCIDLPLFVALQELLPKLEDARAACQATRSAAEVTSILQRAQAAVRARFTSQTTSSPNANETASARSRFLARPEWGPDQLGLKRILHEMQGKLSAYEAGRQSKLSDTIFLRKFPHGEPESLAQQIRVPLAADSPAEAFWQWDSFFQHQIDISTPVLFVLHLDQKWLDITIGEPSSREFFSLKASLARSPLSNEVPYNLDDESREFAGKFIASYRDKINDTNRNGSLASRLIKSLVLLLVLAAIITAYLRFAPAGYIPDFLRGVAGSLGNTNLTSPPKNQRRDRISRLALANIWTSSAKTASTQRRGAGFYSLDVSRSGFVLDDAISISGLSRVVKIV